MYMSSIKILCKPHCLRLNALNAAIEHDISMQTASPRYANAEIEEATGNIECRRRSHITHRKDLLTKFPIPN
jgi:hypothetical protein